MDQAEEWTNRAVEIWLAMAIVNPLALSPVSGPTSPELLASDSPMKVLWFREGTDSLIAPFPGPFSGEHGIACPPPSSTGCIANT